MNRQVTRWIVRNYMDSQKLYGQIETRQIDKKYMDRQKLDRYIKTTWIVEIRYIDS